MDRQVKQLITDWDNRGKDQLSALLTSSAEDAITSHLILYTLLRVAHKTVAQDGLVSFLQAIESRPIPSSSTSTVSTFSDNLADALWQLDAELEDQIATASTNPTVTDAEFTAGLEGDRQAYTELCKAVFATELIPVALYDRFDYPFLERVGASTGTGAQTMLKKATRLGTVTFFSLKKYNLLRESSEGFSLLIILLTSRETLGPGSNPETGNDREDVGSRQTRAKEVWKRIMGITGYFDLDPSRTLDLIFDAFTSSLLTHHRFFVDLLRCSPWAPPSSSVTTDTVNSSTMDLAGETGSSVAAQVLGFKFKHYQDQTVMRRGEEAPKEMVLMTAILVREGLVKLKELWEHLSPSESEMAKHESRHRAAVNQLARNSRGNALLASAAPLVDDEPTPGSSSKLPANPNGTASTAAAPAPLPDLPLPDQKIALVTSLLVVGAQAQTTYLLTRFPHLANTYPEIADLQLRAMAYTLAPTLDRSSPSVPNLSKSSLDARKSTLTLLAPPPIETSTERFVFFFPDWNEQIERCDSVEALFDPSKGVNRALMALGALVGRDARLLVRLVRVAAKDIREHWDDPSVLERWSLPIRIVLLPSLSLLGGSSTSHELWSLLSLYPLSTRYGFYGSWKLSYASSIQLKVQGAIAERDTKAVLRRVSKDDVKLHARALGKLSHSDPTIVWGVVLRQIQSYDNLVKPVVESARFITALSADVLVFVLLDAFSNPDKDRTKTDGTSVSLWLKSLAAFAGELCRRYHLAIDHRPIFRYVANQLRAGNSQDLIILRELLSAMTGIDPLANLSDTQVAALGGGPSLRGEAIHPTVPVSKPPVAPGAELRTQAPVEKRGIVTKSGPQLVASLEEENMMLPLLVLVAQTRDTCLFTVPDEEAHMKSLSTLFDSSTEVLLQYVEFLVQSIGPERYAKLIPSFTELAANFGLAPSLSFHILRPKLTHAIKAYDVKNKVPSETPAAKEARLRQELKDSKRPLTPVPSAGEVAANGAVNGDVEGADSDNARMKKFHPVLNPVIMEVQKFFPAESIKYMGAPFFVTFWQLSPYDIEVPINTYQHEIDRLLKADKELSRYPVSAQVGEWQNDKTKLANKAKQLQDERSEQMELYAATRRRLGTEKMLWFRKFPDLKQVNQQVYQHCIYPRLLLSLEDAAFCAKFVKMMHTMGTQNFASLWYHDHYTFTEWTAPLLASMTENEARNYARYLHDCLQDLMPWQEDETKYSKEALGDRTGEKNADKESVLPGFRAKLLRATTAPCQKEDLLPWNGYRKVMLKWHKRIAGTFETCVDSKEYMHIKNVVIVLQKILPFFPREVGTGEQVEKKLKAAIADETREDLKLLLQSYASQLGKLKPKWVPISQFRAVDPARAAAARSAASSPLATKATLVGETNPGSPLVQASTASSAQPASKLGEQAAPKPAESASKTASSTAASVAVKSSSTAEVSEGKDVKPEKTIPSGPKALANPPLRNGSSRTADVATNGSAAASRSNSTADKVDSKAESSSDKKVEDDKPATRSGMRSDAIANPKAVKELPKGPRGYREAERVERQPSRTADMQPPAGPSSARDAVDIRSSNSNPNLSSRSSDPRDRDRERERDRDREREPRERSPRAGESSSRRAASPTRSRRRSRTPPSTTKTARSGSADSSHSTRSGSRRNGADSGKDRDRETEKEREARKLAERESSLKSRTSGASDSDRDRDRDSNRDRDRRGDRDRDRRPTGGGRDDRDSRRPRSPEPRGGSRADALSSRRGAPRDGGRDTPPHARARSPVRARSPPDSKRSKTDRETRRRSPTPPRGGDRDRKSREAPPPSSRDKTPSSSSAARDSDRDRDAKDRERDRSRRERDALPANPTKAAERAPSERSSRQSSASARPSEVPSLSDRLSASSTPAPMTTSSGLPMSTKFQPAPKDKDASSKSSREPPPHATPATADAANGSTPSSEDRKRSASQREDATVPDGKKGRLVRNHRYALESAVKQATGPRGSAPKGGK